MAWKRTRVPPPLPRAPPRLPPSAPPALTRLPIVSALRVHETHPAVLAPTQQRQRLPPPPLPPSQRKLFSPPPPRSQSALPASFRSVLVSPSPVQSPQHKSRPPPPPHHNFAPVWGQKRPSPTASSALNNKKRCRLVSTCRNVRHAYELDQRKIGQGTFGSVFVGRDRETKTKVALKRINKTPQEEGFGFSFTALREIKLLQLLQHDNIVTLHEVVALEIEGTPDGFFLVLEYFEYDLTGILETPQIRFTLDHVKSWSYQLMSAVTYLHHQSVIHRDLKPANLLINRRGELKVADFGLSTRVNHVDEYGCPKKRLTNMVVSRWYRPPELLLACYNYTSKIDMWSVGCILAELFCRKTLFRGSNDANQLELIYRTVGHPAADDWPKFGKETRYWNKYQPKQGQQYPNRLYESLRSHPQQCQMDNNAAKLVIENLLKLDPEKRWSAKEALSSKFFQPLPKRAHELSMNFPVGSAHEWECHKRQTLRAPGKPKVQDCVSQYVNRLLSSFKERK